MNKYRKDTERVYNNLVFKTVQIKTDTITKCHNADYHNHISSLFHLEIYRLL